MAITNEMRQRGAEILLQSSLFQNTDADINARIFADDVKKGLNPKPIRSYNPHALLKGDRDPDIGETYENAKLMLVNRYFDSIERYNGNYSDIRKGLFKELQQYIDQNTDVYCAARTLNKILNDAFLEIEACGLSEDHKFPFERENIDLETANTEQLIELVTPDRINEVDKETQENYNNAKLELEAVEQAQVAAKAERMVEDDEIAVQPSEEYTKAVDRVKETSKAVIIEADYKRWLEKAKDDPFQSHHSYMRETEQLALHIRALSVDAFDELSETAQSYLRRARQSSEKEENKGAYPREIRAIVHDIIYNSTDIANMFGGNYKNEALRELANEVKSVTDIAPKAMYRALPWQGITDQYSQIEMLKNEMGSQVPMLSSEFRAKTVELLKDYADHIAFQCNDRKSILDTAGQFIQRDDKRREFNGEGQYAAIYSALAHYDNGMNQMSLANPLDKRLSQAVREVAEKSYYANASLSPEILAKNLNVVIEQSATCFEAEVIHCQCHEKLTEATKLKNEVAEKQTTYIDEYIARRVELHSQLNNSFGSEYQTYDKDVEAADDKLGQQMKELICEPRTPNEERWFKAVSDYAIYRLNINAKQAEGVDIDAKDIKSFRAFVETEMIGSGNLVHELDKYLGHRANMEVSLGVDNIVNRVNKTLEQLSNEGLRNVNNIEYLIATPMMNSLARSCSAIVEMNEAAKTYNDERQKLDLLVDMADRYIDHQTVPVWENTAKEIQSMTLEEVQQADKKQQQIQNEMGKKKSLFPTFKKVMQNVSNLVTAVKEHRDEKETEKFFKQCLNNVAECSDVAYCTVYAGNGEEMFKHKDNAQPVLYRPQEGDTAKLVYTLQNNSELIVDKNGGMVYYDAMRGSIQIESIAELRDVVKTAEGKPLNLSFEFETSLSKILENEASQRAIDLKSMAANKPVDHNAVYSRLAAEQSFKDKQSASEERITNNGASNEKPNKSKKTPTMDRE